MAWFGRLQGLDAAGGGRQVELGDAWFVAFGREAVNAAGHCLQLLVRHVVAAHASVVPIGDVEAAVGSDADVGGAEPLVIAGQEIDRFGRIACPLRANRIGANDARPGVAMDGLVLELPAARACLRKCKCR